MGILPVNILINILKIFPESYVILLNMTERAFDLRYIVTMAKKKRRHYIKLNNRIKELFGGLPFDEAAGTLGDDELMELMLLLDQQLPELEREEMVRALRRLWSEGEFSVRKQIVDYLSARRKKGAKAPLPSSGTNEKDKV